MRNILLTGLPRAGTTLAAFLLEQQPDTVCLHEPAWQYPSPELTAPEFAQAVMLDFSDVRKKLLAGVPIPDKRKKDGSAVTNYYESGIDIDEYPLLRPDLSGDFTLAMKHNGPYLSVLPELIALGSFEVHAVIRHPLSVLRSWRRLDLPISRGQMPNATFYWPEMQALTSAKMMLLEKQVRMLELMVERILLHKQHLKLRRYENFASDKMQASERPTAEDGMILEALQLYAPAALECYRTSI